MAACYYIVHERIGGGSYGDVHRATHKATGQRVAIKSMEVDETQGVPYSTLREVSLLSRLSHPNVVHLIDWAIVKGCVRLVLPYCETDLHSFLLLQRADGGVPAEVARSMTFQLLCGVAYLHSVDVAHRDLKPGNLLVCDGGRRVRIADFGCGRRMVDRDRDYSPVFGTKPYRAPEALLGATRYGFSVDVWACGCIASELVTGERLFRGETDVAVLAAIFVLVGAPPQGSELWRQWTTQGGGANAHAGAGGGARDAASLASLHPTASAACLDLLSRMLCLTDRIAAHEAASHPHFTP